MPGFSTGRPYPLVPKRWMLFVDGENLTIRADKVAEHNGVALREGKFYCPGVFVWLTRLAKATDSFFPGNAPSPLERSALRAYYYTSVLGDDSKLNSIRAALWNLGFHPEVFKKPRHRKSKGVDIALTKDVLSHAFLGNYDVAVLVAGDGDYVPLINEVKRLGKIVYLVFFRGSGLNLEAKLAADWFLPFDSTFVNDWKEFGK